MSTETLTDHDLDAEIGAAMRESVEAHRERQRSTWADFIAAWERLFKRPYPGNEITTLTVLMFVSVLGCSWIAEQTLAGGI